MNSKAAPRPLFSGLTDDAPLIAGDSPGSRLSYDRHLRFQLGPSREAFSRPARSSAFRFDAEKILVELKAASFLFGV